MFAGPNMSASTQLRSPPVLQVLDDVQTFQFTTPVKQINDGDDLTFFFSSIAYRDLTAWLLQLNRSMFPTKTSDGKVQPCRLDDSLPPSESVQNVKAMLDSLGGLVNQAPPDTGPRRFGNVAFRSWSALAEESSEELLRKLHLSKHDEWPHELYQELKSYLLGSFGSAQRLDYGTGHELSFLAFLGCLWKVGAFEPGEERAIVLGILQPYLLLVRKLIMVYTLEPAGSHGVWGLDDHSFLPYIYGSAQFGPPISPDQYAVPTEGSLPRAPKPSAVTNLESVGNYKDSNMYFSAIQFIYDVKRGPFWEHSPVLYDVSGIKDGWGKINKGMLKMYAAEVLGKFPVVQHFTFGSLFCWQRDPQAVQTTSNLHAQQQPIGHKKPDVPPPSSVGTRAPWPTSAGKVLPDAATLSGPQAAPGARMNDRTGGTLASDDAARTFTTAAPWAGVQTASNTPPTTRAPWAVKR